MKNLSLLYYSTFFLISSSPLHAISYSTHLNFFHCSFTKSFQPIIYTKNPKNIIEIQNCNFLHLLKSSIIIRYESCYSFAEIQYHSNKIIKNAIFKPENFYYQYEDKRVFISCSEENEAYGNLTILSCIFDHCYAPNNGGGAISIQQQCSVFFHELFFYECFSNRDGGAIRAMGYEYDVALENFDMQYICVQNCKCKELGSSFYIISKNCSIRFSTCFANTLLFPNGDDVTPNGAIVDLNSQIIDLKSINVTKGRSKYTAGMEIRNSIMDSIKFITFENINGQYIATFNRLKIDIDFSYSNFISNEINGKFSVILSINCNSSFEKISFINTKYSDEDGLIISTEYDDYEPLVIFKNCYFDDLKTKLPSFVDEINCNFETIFTQNNEYLNYKSCKGQITPEYLFLTSIFSKSFEFTQSSYFPSKYFTESIRFTQSILFSKTVDFSLSGQFSDSSDFTSSKSFSNSFCFTKSRIFSETYKFSKSEGFTFSEQFSKSYSFSPSKSFKFTESNCFTMSLAFNNTNYFTRSDIFTASQFYRNFNPNKEETIKNSMTQILVTARSVSLSQSFFTSYSYSFIMLSDGIYSITLIVNNFETYIPYIIHILSPSYIQTNYLIKLKVKKGISESKLIGIVCGSVSVFFLAACIVIFIVRKSWKNEVNSNDTSLSFSSDIENNSKSDNENKIEIANIISPIGDVWL